MPDSPVGGHRPVTLSTAKLRDGVVVDTNLALKEAAAALPALVHFSVNAPAVKRATIKKKPPRSRRWVV